MGLDKLQEPKCYVSMLNNPEMFEEYLEVLDEIKAKKLYKWSFFRKHSLFYGMIDLLETDS